jgi:hypothetical protein
MWTINSFNIFNLRTPGGDRFTEFVDALIKAEAYIQSITLSEISTNLRTNLGDGGVDTEVRQPAPNSLTGWMSVPTCWQYKATGFAGITPSDLKQELNKPYSKQLIEQGYGYRFCICDDLTSEKKRDWERILDDEIAKINPNAPKSKVITASDLAIWANQYPAIVVRFFQPQFVNSLAFEDWGMSIAGLTSEYVEVNLWASIKQQIIEHINFNNSPSNVILPLQGEAGVGKTRLVYETLSSIEEAKNLVLYAVDKKAIDIAYPLAREREAKIILIADECLPQTQAELQNILGGVKDRIRVVCIDNSGERIDTFTQQLWLERIPEEDVDTILKKNFLTVPPDRRHAYVNLSRGFIRLAADLCNQDSQIAAQGNINSVLSDTRTYLRNRLNDDSKLRVVEAISLFRKVGYRDEVREELDLLCKILKLDRDNILEIAQQLKDVPGYIAFAGRYLYITPEIIAQVSFAGGWKRWIQCDPPTFLNKIPQPLLDAFLHRVSTSSSEEVRRIVGEFFQHWTTQLQPIDLSNLSKVEKFIVLIKINPEDYLPQLANLVERASKEELLQIAGGFINGTGTRRSLVWLAEKMAAFPEFFSYAELILWKLALAETEFNVANNATHVWQQFFRIYLSGTAVPFRKRIDLLETRLFSEQEEEINLALECLSQTFNTSGSRIVGSPVVAGRIPPENWQPQTQLELKECFDKALAILSKAARSNIDNLKNGALNVAIQCLSILLANGYLEQVKTIFSADNISQEILVSLIRSLENFLEFNSDASTEIKQWLQSLLPNDFHGKLIQTVGKSPWSYSLRDNQEAWRQEINNLAQQLYEDRELLKFEMQWLTSPQAIMIENLGSAIGKYDTDAVCLDTIMESVAKTQATGLARGYIVGLLSSHPQHNAVINEWIDKFETQIPTIAYELFRAGGKNTKAVERALKLVDIGSLSLEYLGGFFSGLLSFEEFYEILTRLVRSVIQEKNESVTKTAIKLIAYRLEIDQRENNTSIVEEIKIQGLVWQLLEVTAQYIRTEEYNWEKILRSVAKFDVERAIKIATLAILSKNDQQKIRAEQILVDLAKIHPDLVMDNVGKIILDDEYGWHFEIEQYRFLIQNLPLDAIKKWLRSVGIVGARRIAKQLSLPYLDEDGKPIVPPLTEFVLSQFEDDEDTFRKFCISSHNLQVYVGDTVAHKNKEVEIARSFLNHPLRRIREWANYEIDNCQRDAKHWQQINEETRIS